MNIDSKLKKSVAKKRAFVAGMRSIYFSSIEKLYPRDLFIFNRGYVDFSWLWSIKETKAFFVTRPKTSIKSIKQNLMVKSFSVTSANAFKTQILISMIVYLSLAIMKE
jgi:hypothetical protein